MGLIAFKQGIGTNPDLLPPTLYEITMYRKDDGYIKAANRTFVWVPVEVMESPAWCNLSINAGALWTACLSRTNAISPREWKAACFV